MKLKMKLKTILKFFVIYIFLLNLSFIDCQKESVSSRNPFVYDMPQKYPFQCNRYLSLVTENKEVKTCAYVNMKNTEKCICVGDKIDHYVVKDIRPEGIVVCAGDNCQTLICFPQKNK